MNENVNTISRITVGGTTYELKSNVIPKIVTWEELKKLKDSNELSPGLKYRITDYIATVSSDINKNALSTTGIGFDIIVEALTTSKLNEIVQACYYSRGDNGVFENCNLNAWKIRYCFDNDTSRFAWADSKNGKGVIYWMEDEWGNVTNYDFKGIKFNNKYTFGNSFQDYSLNGSCSGNKIGINKDNNGYLTPINLGPNSKNNNIGNNCSNITFTTIEGTTIGNNCKDLNITKCINSRIGNNVSDIEFNTGEHGIENLTICDNNSNITINLKKNNESAKNLKILEGTTGSEGWIINDLETSSDFLTVIEKRKDNNGEYRIYKDPYLEIKEEIDTKYDESNLFQTVELDLKDHEWVTLPREIKVGSIVTINLIKSTSPSQDKTNPLDFRIYAASGYSPITNLNYSQSASKTFLVTKGMIKDGVSTKSIQMYTGSSKTESTAKIQIIYHDELRKYIDEVLDRPQVIYTDLSIGDNDSSESYIFDRVFREYDYVGVSILNTGSELTTILGEDNKLYLYSDDITHGTFTKKDESTKTDENKTIYLKKAGTRIWCQRSGLTSNLKDSNITIKLSITIPNRDRTSSYFKNETKRSLTGENIWLGNFDNFNKLQEILDNFWYTETNNNTTIVKGSCVGSFGASISNREYVQIYSTSTYINGGHWQQVMSGFFMIDNDKSIKSTSSKFSIIYRNRISDDVNTKWSDWKYLDDELNTKINELEKRIQGTSDNSNPSTDPFRVLITVGDINSKDSEGNNLVLNALNALHSTKSSDNFSGKWRIISSNNAYDVENIVIHYGSENWLQVFHGPFLISDDGFKFDSFDYRISWRLYKNGVWSNWYCRDDDFNNNIEKNSSAILKESTRAQEAEAALQKQIDELPTTGGGGTGEIADGSITEQKLSLEVNNKLNTAYDKAKLSDTLRVNDGIAFTIGALTDDGKIYQGTNFRATSLPLYTNGEIITVNQGYLITKYVIYYDENTVEVGEVNLTSMTTFEFNGIENYYIRFEIRKADNSSIDENELTDVVKSFIRKPITWNNNCDLNNFTPQGRYTISGERQASAEDNMPILNGGKVEAVLDVLSKDNCATQVLTLLNVGGGDGNIYIRTKQGNTWGSWKGLGNGEENKELEEKVSEIDSIVKENEKVTASALNELKENLNDIVDSIDNIVTLNVATATSPGLMSSDNYNNLIEVSSFLSKLKTEFETEDLDVIVSKLASLK